MRRPGTDESNVQMSDVLCDYCHRPWTADGAMVEGHKGSCICGRCLTIAYTEVVMHHAASEQHRENDGDVDGDGDNDAIATADVVQSSYVCTMCLEGDADRAELKRAGEPGWRSPLHDDAAICRRCIKQAAGALHKDRDIQWTKPDRV